MEPNALPVSDPGELVGLVNAVGDRAIDRDQAEFFLSSPTSVAIGGYLDQERAGYLLAYVVARVDGTRMVIVYDVAVAISSRRHGVARSMVQKALGYARSLGATKAWVITDRVNGAAVGLYRATGAEPSGQDDAVMWWPLA